MSNLSGNNSRAESDLGHWEFVHCAVCFLPFVPDPVNAPAAPPSIPFWLTECGHIICNNHLNADQSCAPCGAQSIQLVPLQRDMAPPMSDWFRSVPHSLDAIANAAKFQQETMASLVRFYKRKCSQQRAALSKSKDVIAENKALRSQIDQLQRENEQLRGSAAGSQHVDPRFAYGSNRQDVIDEALTYEPSHSRNVNGKRPLTSAQHHQRTSSPRSIITPVAPPRLTLPTDHQQPVFPSGMVTASGGRDRQAESTGTRPGSSRFEQYAYQPPETVYRAQPLRHQQQPQSHRRQPQIQEDGQHQQQQARTQPQVQAHPQQQRMQPPPTPSRAHGSTSTAQHQRAVFRPAGQGSFQNARRAPMQMLPPAATPRQSRPLQPQPFPMSVPGPSSASSHVPSTASREPGTNDASVDHRFAVPSTPSNRFFPPRATPGVSGGASRTQAYPGTGGTRAPFVPEMV